MWCSGVSGMNYENRKFFDKKCFFSNRILRGTKLNIIRLQCGPQIANRKKITYKEVTRNFPPYPFCSSIYIFLHKSNFQVFFSVIVIILMEKTKEGQSPVGAYYSRYILMIHAPS